jgi:hypothetical protein
MFGQKVSAFLVLPSFIFIIQTVLKFSGFCLDHNNGSALGSFLSIVHR